MKKFLIFSHVNVHCACALKQHSHFSMMFTTFFFIRIRCEVILSFKNSTSSLRFNPFSDIVFFAVCCYFVRMVNANGYFHIYSELLHYLLVATNESETFELSFALKRLFFFRHIDCVVFACLVSYSSKTIHIDHNLSA